MARITNIPETFTQVGPLAADEIWQVHDGTVLISLEAGADAERGLRLTRWETLEVLSGKTVYYRRLGASAAVLSREVTG
jgi:hypothetical protein